MLRPVGCTVDSQGCPDTWVRQRMSRSGGNLDWQSAPAQSVPVFHDTTPALQASQECIERVKIQIKCRNWRK
jgi:hypothetical protein